VTSDYSLAQIIGLISTTLNCSNTQIQSVCTEVIVRYIHQSTIGLALLLLRAEDVFILQFDSSTFNMFISPKAQHYLGERASNNSMCHLDHIQFLLILATPFELKRLEHNVQPVINSSVWLQISHLMKHSS
jgi:hypothetical protein